jgi:hypothetical protein
MKGRPRVNGDHRDTAITGTAHWLTITFGEAKHILSMVLLRLRGLTGARDEFLLTATVQNLKRLAKHTTRRPPQPMMASSNQFNNAIPHQQIAEAAPKQLSSYRRTAICGSYRTFSTSSATARLLA